MAQNDSKCSKSDLEISWRYDLASLTLTCKMINISYKYKHSWSCTEIALASPRSFVVMGCLGLVEWMWACFYSLSGSSWCATSHEENEVSPCCTWLSHVTPELEPIRSLLGSGWDQTIGKTGGSWRVYLVAHVNAEHIAMTTLWRFATILFDFPNSPSQSKQTKRTEMPCLVLRFSCHGSRLTCPCCTQYVHVQKITECMKETAS